MELILRFSSPQQVVVTLDGEESSSIDFTSPFSDADLQELCWYLEIYAAAYIMDVDDARAGRLVVRLKHWGTDLFKAVFQDWAAGQLFREFLTSQEAGRVLTISATQPEILTLPWELLHVPDGAYLFNEKPRIAIRRNLSGTRGGRSPMQVEPKDQLRLLFVVSRPEEEGFIDPRSEGLAVMTALEQVGAERVAVEFLRPATLDRLVERLEDERLPKVDILHFDGHGVFDATGQFREKGKQGLPQREGLKVSEGDGKDVGYLLFEKPDGKRDLVPAELLGQLLNQQGLGLVVLSACQSATTAGEEAMGSVAARLTQTGVPSVLAMSYSVLVSTTERLFGSFYEQLVQGRSVGESLDYARRKLLSQPERGERQREQDRVTLRLSDWFVPTLYQAGQAGALVCPDRIELESRVIWSNLPPMSETGFWGRQRELWQIERAFITRAGKEKQQETRRLTIAGFGGQGKTALAQEAGRWLLQTGMFDAVCFVDYAAFQGRDAVALAVSTIATVLQQNLIDAAAVTRALQARSTLVILDNLEAVTEEVLQELLAIAKAWSEAGQSRVVLTTRQMEWNHPDYPSGGSYRHQLMQLRGLGSAQAPQAAIDYFQALMKLPPVPEVPLPDRSALINLFNLVDWHPLSIRLVAAQLRSRRVAEVGQALERLLAEVPAEQDKDKSLIASLNLSLERLDERSRELVKRLGVFEGGAMELDLLAITELTEEEWQPLRQQLMAAGLVQPEVLSGINVPYLRFHPTLARVLWMRLSATEQKKLQRRHREHYFALSIELLKFEQANPVEARAIAMRVLPNLLVAVRGALTVGEAWGVEFATNVNRFLDVFGMNRDLAELTALIKATAVSIGSQTWFLARSNEGDQLLNSGQNQAAAQIFQTILQELGDLPSYNRCLTLLRLGRSNWAKGLLDYATQWYWQALTELAQLDQSTAVKRELGVGQAGLGDVLRDLGQRSPARQAYEASLAIAQEISDLRMVAVVEAQLGGLDFFERNFPEAERRYRKALSTFQTLNEPAMEAVAWHQLGIVYEAIQTWEAAEQAYRESARIKEAQGMIGGSNGAITTWNQLADLLRSAGKSREAEEWYCKTIAGYRSVDEQLLLSRTLINLADLLCSQSNRLPEARQLAEESLVIQQNFDPAAVELWATYSTLVNIATQENDFAQAQIYQRLEQQSYANYAGSQFVLQKFEDFIQTAVTALENEAAQQRLEEQMSKAVEGWQDFNVAVQQILMGERDEWRLCDSLDRVSAMIVREILRRIE